jgi:hypothetical protein
MTIKPALRKIILGILHTEDESKQSYKRAGSDEPQEQKGQVIRE